MTDDQIKNILEKSKTIAMIGISSEKKGEDPKNLKRKPANVVMKYMQDFGYKVYPINPFAEGEIVNNEKVLADLKNVPEKIDIVDVLDLQKKHQALHNKLKKSDQKFYGCNMEFIVTKQKQLLKVRIWSLYLIDVLSRSTKRFSKNLILFFQH